MDCKDVEDIIKGVLKDESQESQEAQFPLCSVAGPSRQVPPPSTQSHGMVSPSRVNPPGKTFRYQLCVKLPLKTGIHEMR